MQLMPSTADMFLARISCQPWLGLRRTHQHNLLSVTAPANAQTLLQVFEAAPQDVRGVPAKKAAPDYFL